MPNSADNSPAMNRTLDEDSDVIELTEEIDGDPDDSPLPPEDDGLGFAIPEFPLPSLDALSDVAEEPGAPPSPSNMRPVPSPGDDSPQEDVGVTQPIAALPESLMPGAAIFGRRTRRAESGAAVAVEQPAASAGDDEALPEFRVSEEAIADPHDEDTLRTDELPSESRYDRQELVRTIQLQAVDRAEIERQIELELLARAPLLDDQRFAPDVLVSAPRILTRRWQDWKSLAALPLSPEVPPVASSPPPVIAPPAVTSRQITPQPQPPVARQSTPPQPQAPAATPPQQQQQPSAAAAPPRHQQASAQPRPQQLSSLPTPKQVTYEAIMQAAGPGPQDGLDGLVQELLDESNKKPAAAPMTRGRAAREVWFKEIFSDEFFRTLSENIDTVTEREVDFIERSLSLQPGARIFDLACGFGRHALLMSQRNYELVGLDLAMPMLTRAVTGAQRHGLGAKFLHGDMRNLNFVDAFDGCYMWQTSFGYFDDLTNFKVLQGIWRALKVGGRLLIDVVNRDYVVAEMPARSWWEGQDCIFLEEVDFDYAQSFLHTKRSFIYEDGTPPLEQNSFIRLYTLHELSNLMANAGFRILEVSGAMHHRARFLGAASPRMILLAEKLPPQQKQPRPQAQPQPS